MSTFLKPLLIVFLTLVIFLSLVYFSFFHVSSLKKINPRETAIMAERGGSIHQIWVPLSRISPLLRQLVIVAEDGTFYQHNGIDPHEFRESLKKDLEEKRFARGFSTITMQVAKNLYLSSQKSLPRKALEILIAYRLEQVLSKQRILEIYLNIIEWGPGIYGAEAASQHYFGKSTWELSPEEAAFLTAIIPNPKSWGHWPPGPYVQERMELLLQRIGSF